MKFPQLVPERVCKTPCKVYRTDGLNRDGSKKQTVIFEANAFTLRSQGRNYPQRNSL